MEHPTPKCTACGGVKTRPLDRNVAVCFDCENEWVYDEDYSEYWDSYA